MQMRNYAVADDDGNIMQIYSTSRRLIACDEAVNDIEHYVTDSDGIEKKAAIDCDVLVSDLAATITGLPEGLNVDTNGMNTLTDSEPLIISYDVPGTYIVRLSGRAEYLDHEMEVTVGDA